MKNVHVYLEMGHDQRLEEGSLQHGQLEDPGDPNNQKTKYSITLQKYMTNIRVSISSDHKKPSFATKGIE